MVKKVWSLFKAIICFCILFYIGMNVNNFIEFLDDKTDENHVQESTIEQVNEKPIDLYNNEKTYSITINKKQFKEKVIRVIKEFISTDKHEKDDEEISPKTNKQEPVEIVQPNKRKEEKKPEDESKHNEMKKL